MNTETNRIDRSVNCNRDTAMKNLIAASLVKAAAVKSALVRALSEEYANVGPNLVYQAVNEADALASLTFVPHLVLPTLAEEKVQKLAAWAAHQRSMLCPDSVSLAA